MRTRILSAIFCIACLSGSQSIVAQVYEQTPVTVSKEKVKGSDGKIYYSHVVLEKQTLFSIAKAYGVSVDDICNANPDYDLKNAGLKKNSIILIPVVASQDGGKTVASQKADTQIDDKSQAKSQNASKSSGKKNGDDVVHTAKWYEDIEDIAFKYSVPVDVLMKYNGLSSKKLKNRQKLRIPSAEEVNRIQAELGTRKVVSDKAGSYDSATQEKSETESKDNGRRDNSRYNHNPVGRSKISALLMMPFNANGTPSESSMDFYSGALMAVKKLSDEGISTELSVYDANGSSVPVTSERLRVSDFCIGPLKTEGLTKVLTLAPEDTYVVSPLDHKTAGLTLGHNNFIQAPTSQSTQYSDLVNWLKSENTGADKVIVLSEKGAAANSSVTLMNSIIEASGIHCSRYSYNILEGRNAVNVLSGLMTTGGTNRVIINSESEAFVNDAVRNLGMLVYRKYKICLYSTSKIRSFETIDVENLHDLNTRISTAYYIDYDNPSTRDFILSYRALYNAEPSQFAFQGYDLTYYLIKANATYGDAWIEMAMRNNSAMLQTDFRFIKSENGGYSNVGVRRIVYGPDYSIRIVRK